MQDQLVIALMSKLQPLFYFIGVGLVLFMTTCGGAIISLWWKSREKELNKSEELLESLKSALEANTISIVRLEVQVKILSEKYDKDLRALGNKIRGLSV